MTVKTKFLALSFSLLLGVTALILTLTLVPKSQETRRRAFESPTNITDNFEQQGIDLTKWRIDSGNVGGIIETQQGKLKINIPENTPVDSNDGGISAVLNTKLTGDFIVEVDLTNAEINNTEGWVTGLVINGNGQIRWMRQWNAPEETYGRLVGDYYDPVTQQWKWVAEALILSDSTTPIRVKIVRSGNTIQWFYDQGTGYQLFGQETQDQFGEEKEVHLINWHWNNKPAITGYFDNFSLTFNPQITTQSIDPPANLTAACAYSGKEVTLAWDTVTKASNYLFRINDPRNDAPSCGDGWWCSDPPDKAINENLTAPSYIHTNITPNQNYRAWVHAHLSDSLINSEAAGIDFTCPSPITGDINLDKIVDISDYSLLVNQTLKPDANLTADFNQDGKIDMTDYSLLVTNFGQTRP